VRVVSLNPSICMTLYGLPVSFRCCTPGTEGSIGYCCAGTFSFGLPERSGTEGPAIRRLGTLLVLLLFLCILSHFGFDSPSSAVDPLVALSAAVAAAAFAAGAGLLLSGGHDVLLLDGRRWWDGRVTRHAEAVRGRAEQALGEVTAGATAAARLARRVSFDENMSSSDERWW